MKKFIALLLSVCLLFSHVISARGNDSVKIDPALLVTMESSSPTDLIPVIIWLTDIDQTEVDNQYSLLYAKESQFSISPLQTEFDETLSSKDIDSFVEAKRQISKDIYSRTNQEKFEMLFPSKAVHLLKTTAVEQPTITYLSVYTPTICLDLTKDEIYSICQNGLVDMIYYNPPPEDGDGNTSNISTQVTQTAYIRDTLSFKGDGIKIGQLEAYVPTFDNTNFTLNNTSVDSASIASSSSTHEEQVAYIMVGKNHGIAPNATLYCAGIQQRAGGWRASLEWLISKGVNVINISNTLGKSTGVYGEHSRWIDHVAINHDVHVVIGAGNVDGSKKVIEAAMGNNVICVGGTDDKNTVSTSDDTFYSSSLYVTSTYKPDLCAPAVGISTPFSTGTSAYNTGTSFSTPQVTAAIAQLCQQRSILKTRQDLVKSMLLAGTRLFEKTSSSGTGNNIAMSYQYGSGMLNAKNSRYVNQSGRFRADTLVSGKNTYTQTFTVSSSDTYIRVALAWLRNSRFSSEDHNTSYPSSVELAKMKLTVKAPNGTTWTSYDTRGSVQLVAFVPPQAGTYTITIERTSMQTSSTHFAICWY